MLKRAGHVIIDVRTAHQTFRRRVLCFLGPPQVCGDRYTLSSVSPGSRIRLDVSQKSCLVWAYVNLTHWKESIVSQGLNLLFEDHRTLAQLVPSLLLYGYFVFKWASRECWSKLTQTRSREGCSRRVLLRWPPWNPIFRNLTPLIYDFLLDLQTVRSFQSQALAWFIPQRFWK